MEYHLNERVKELCRREGLQLKDLALKIGIAPESLSRAINGNPQLSTIKSIAEGLGVGIPDLFTSKKDTQLNAIIVFNGKAYTAQCLSDLKLCINEIEAESKKHY